MSIMNKLKNRFFVALAVGIGAFSLYSCSDSFLDEVDSRGATADFFDTPDGMRALAIGLPSSFRLHSSHEYSYPMTNYGTDEFAVGSDPAGQPWNDYDVRLQSRVTSSSNTTQPYQLWEMAYVFLNSCNLTIAKAPAVLAGQPDLNTILGEAHFVRGWLYFWLLQQWGDVPLVIEPPVGMPREFPRTPKAEVLAQVIEDFQFAYDNLTNPASRTTGKIYKDAAAHFLAKALVYRQSEINGNAFSATRDTDLSKALTLCDEVIAHRPLAPNFMDLFDYTGPDGANENLPEVLISAQYSKQSNGANGQFTNMLGLQFVSIYQNWFGIERNLEGGREYARLRTTDYAMDVYDRVNDSRFWKSFRTAQTVNVAARTNDGQTGWPAGPNQAWKKGQMAVAYIINNSNDTRFKASPAGAAMPGSTAALQPPFILISNDNWASSDTVRSRLFNLPNDPAPGNSVPNVLPRYRVDANNNPVYALPTGQENSIWPTMSKYLDGARNSFNDEGSQRDVIKARVAETYLLAAEILIRQGHYQDAISKYINPLRTRAQYKSGENRAEQKHGGQAFTASSSSEFTHAQRGSSFSPVNTYYLSNNIPVTTSASNLQISSYTSLPAEDEAIIAKLGYTTEYDRMMCFLLNERSRELMGELLRWEDLARTKTLIDRGYAFNDGIITANSLAEHHYLRPIPLEYINGVQENGEPLNNTQKTAYQNPGYQ